MARIAYADTRSPEHAATAARIVAERGSVLNLYAMLLHSGPVAEGWLAFLTAIRQKCSLSAKDRELVIMHIAVLNEAPYEFDQHVPFAMKARSMRWPKATLRPSWSASRTSSNTPAR
jgi:alkylhydroperoxidase family enzyme